jgi:hypothetical protein
MISTLLSTATSSNVASVAITSGIDSTYDHYMFVCTDINPETTDVQFTFQVNAAGGSGFNETITSAFFKSYHNEADDETSLSYAASSDQAQGTAYQELAYGVGSGADESCAGIMHLFSPSSTTYVKHFYSRFNGYYTNDFSFDYYCSGYINTTAAIDEISFKMSSDNFDGVIQMYGIS